MFTHNKVITIADGSDTTLIRGTDWNGEHVIPKIASENLRNSHDAQISTGSLLYTKLKTITLNQKLTGAFRIKFDIKHNTVGLVYGKIYKNGSPYGTEQSTSSDTYVTKSEDFTDSLPSGTTLELWGKIDGINNCFVRNFRLYYDNEDLTTVSITNS